MKFIKTLRILLVATIIVLPVILYGCSESGGSSSVEPMADEPMILDAVLCISVKNDRPDGITDTFYRANDDRIYFWVYWTNLEDVSTAKAVWYEPDKDIPFREDSQTIRTDSGFGITWFYIDEPMDGFKTGEWSVEIYLNGKLERSLLFTVE